MQWPPPDEEQDDGTTMTYTLTLLLHMLSLQARHRKTLSGRALRDFMVFIKTLPEYMQDKVPVQAQHMRRCLHVCTVYLHLRLHLVLILFSLSICLMIYLWRLYVVSKVVEALALGGLYAKAHMCVCGHVIQHRRIVCCPKCNAPRSTAWECFYFVRYAEIMKLFYSIPKMAELMDYPQWRQQPVEGELEDFFDGKTYKEYVHAEGFSGEDMLIAMCPDGVRFSYYHGKSRRLDCRGVEIAGAGLTLVGQLEERKLDQFCLVSILDRTPMALAPLRDRYDPKTVQHGSRRIRMDHVVLHF